MILSFDLWNTLIKPNPEFKQSKYLIFKPFSTFSESKTKEIISDVDHFITISDEKTGRQTYPEQIVFSILKELNPHHNYENVNSHTIFDILGKLEQSFDLYSPSLYNENTLETLINLHNEQHHMVISSNTGLICGKKIKSLLKKLKINTYFNNFIFSDELGYCKPDINFFSHLNNLRSLNNEIPIIHIGDSLSADKAGIIRWNLLNPKHKIEYIIINNEKENDISISDIPFYLDSSKVY